MAKSKKDKITSIADFEKRFADRRIDIQEAGKRSGVYTTGSIALDKRLKGGIPKGKMTELYGPPGGGKTTLAIRIAAKILEQGGTVIYKDLERGLDLRDETFDAEGFIAADALKAVSEEDTEAHIATRRNWLRTNGIDLDNPNFQVYDPESGEELFEMLGAEVSLKLADLIIVDSVPAILPASVLDGLPGEATYGARAKLLSEELPRLLRLYRDNYDTSIIFINQVRENIGAQVKSHKTTGGFALEHFVRCKLKVQRIDRKFQGDDVVTVSRVKIEKNMYGENQEEMIRISAKRGVDTLSEILDYALASGYVHKSGSWHYLFDAPVEAEAFTAAWKRKEISALPGYVTGLNGEAAALDFMAANGWEAKLFELAAKV